MKKIALLLLFSGATALAQYPTQQPQAKYVPKPEDFRVVTNQTFNIQLSKLWVNLDLAYSGKTNNLAYVHKVVREATYQDVEIAPAEKPDRMSRAGLFTGLPPVPGQYSAIREQVKVGETVKNGQLIVLRNCPPGLGVGETFQLKALRCGTTNELELWDCGSPVPQPKP